MKEFKIEPRNYDSFDELAEELFWDDRYIIDDGQYIYDVKEDVLYIQSLPYFRTVQDLFGTGEVFDMVEVDGDIRQEILEEHYR